MRKFLTAAVALCAMSVAGTAMAQKKVFALTSGLGSSELTARRGGFYAYRFCQVAHTGCFKTLLSEKSSSFGNNHVFA